MNLKNPIEEVVFRLPALDGREPLPFEAADILKIKATILLGMKTERGRKVADEHLAKARQELIEDVRREYTDSVIEAADVLATRHAETITALKDRTLQFIIQGERIAEAGHILTQGIYGALAPEENPFGDPISPEEQVAHAGDEIRDAFKRIGAQLERNAIENNAEAVERYWSRAAANIDERGRQSGVWKFDQIEEIVRAAYATGREEGQLLAAVPRVLMTVSGGKSAALGDPGVQIEIFNFDNYRDDPNKTPKVSREFADLAAQMQAPVENIGGLVIDRAERDRRSPYNGPIVDGGQNYVVQDLGGGEGVLHLTRHLDQVPEKGRSVRIAYDDQGKGKVTTKDRTRSNEQGR